MDSLPSDETTMKSARVSQRGTQFFVGWSNSIGFIAVTMILGRLCCVFAELKPPARSSDPNHVHRMSQPRRNP